MATIEGATRMHAGRAQRLGQRQRVIVYPAHSDLLARFVLTNDLEVKLRARLRQIAREPPRWGWKTVYPIQRREGWAVNRNRVQRLWREEGLKRPQFCRKRRRLGPTLTGRLRASRPNEVWAIDFCFDETADGRRLKLANMVDEFTREALAMRVGRSCTADQLVDLIEALMAAGVRRSTCVWATARR